jgi:hypothetical protein
MSTTIITNQTAVRFAIKDIIKGLDLDPCAKGITPLLDKVYGSRHLINTWQAEYVFLIEEFIESNVSPQIPKWNAFLPVIPEYDIVCGYIREALTSFEGGMVRFKGSSHTSPESALRKLRNTLKDAPSFTDYLRYNPRGFDFIFDMHEDIDADAKSIIEALGFDLTKKCYNLKTNKNEVGFIRFNIPVRKISDIVQVIVVTSLSEQTKKVSTPRYQSTVINKITNSMLEKVRA